ncbi:aminomethyl-transferring glycine dehydrogenase subunit GcvPA [Sphaerochaeta sp. PS]|uniref:aminomethyl-transferring glycine dehydrogenase subunit GcvPA n=1 Tax=Sphaerochaeta sp. PS TaxID=3076336 RepID=UPI0028A3B3F5|nr:aminomethyl-transferring glycine dehydrogenase subunit GcvPA [Sphaerochaeta sp. PS]MDT4761379.1 aminomethyl-transferring glycine dehydrogenase subunit GcvPA [Sphaerochaeta sp. PS]
MVYPYIPHTDEDRRRMLEAIGVSSIEELYSSLTEDLLLSDSVPISHGRTEDEVLRMITAIAQRNSTGIPFLGCGCYDHLVPSTVQTLASLPSFVTAYTPYQAEMSQGLLQVIYEFQSMICEITGMDISNASLYDGANAAAEAATIMISHKRKSSAVLVSSTIHPFTLQVLNTWALGTGHEIRLIPERQGVTDLKKLDDLLQEEVAGLIVQTPNRYGLLEDFSGIADTLHAKGCLLAISSDLLSLAMQKSPAEWGADIAVGDTQALGLPLAFGGPSCGYMAVSTALMRKIPGRIVGATVDKQGRRGYTLTLQAREQHIKREKASSNVCSNQALAALMTTIHLSSLGWGGMVEAAKQSYVKAHYLAYHLAQLPGMTLVWDVPFWCEFPLVFSDAKKMRKFLQELRNEGIFAGVRLSGLTRQVKDELVLLVAVTEKRSREELELYLAAARRVMK